eukprot:8307147-Pyramimonas_sp.AAC.1
MEGGPLSTCGSRRSAARIRLNMLQQFHGWWAGGLQHVVLALAPHIRLKSSHEFHECIAVPVQNAALALAPRTLGRQDATVTLIRGVSIPGMVSRSSSIDSNGFLPTGHFHQ